MPAITSYPAGRPAWVDLLSRDRTTAMRFYAELFGWTYDVGPRETGSYTICLLRGEPVAGIGASPPSTDGFPAPPPAWTTYFATADVGASLRLLERHDGTGLLGPVDILEEARIAVAVDPGGAVFGLWQAGKHSGARLVGESGTPSWYECAAGDTAAAARFYSTVFGFSVDPDQASSCSLLRLDGDVVGGLVALGSDGDPAPAMPRWDVHFAVADVEETVGRAVAAGATVLDGPRDGRRGVTARLRDPEEATFAIRTLPTP